MPGMVALVARRSRLDLRALPSIRMFSLSKGVKQFLSCLLTLSCVYQRCFVRIQVGPAFGVPFEFGFTRSQASICAREAMLTSHVIPRSGVATELIKHHWRVLRRPPCCTVHTE